MKIKLPYYHQDKNYSCGPVALRMIFGHLGIDYSEEKLIRLCHTVPVTGTSHKHLIDEVRKENLYYKEETLSSIDNLIHFLDKGYPVLVNYINPLTKNGHYAVVCGYENENLILADPKNGEDFHINCAKFMKNWHNTKNSSKGWLLLISKDVIKV